MVLEIITTQEYEKKQEDYRYRPVLLRNIYHVGHCKVDMVRQCAIGAFLIPQKEKLAGDKQMFGFYLTKEQLTFIDDSHIAEKVLQSVLEEEPESAGAAPFFFKFLECIIQGDSVFLQQYEEKLSELESQLLDGQIEDFERKLLNVRKELLTLSSYYQQLIDFSDTLEENHNKLFCEEECRAFHLFGTRVDRLFDNTHRLQEYSLQLRELYESQIDLRQNQIMKVLTVVTTIFMPLTLIAGWYGMNFINMPELRSSYGYVAIAIISVLIIIVEIILFKIKKWFD